MCSTDPSLRKKEHCFPLKMRLITFISCSEGYWSSAREEGTSLHSSYLKPELQISCWFYTCALLMPGWSKCNICNKFKCPGSGRVLLTLNQICYQSCKHLCKGVTAHLVLTIGSTCLTVHQGWSQCLCRQESLRVAHAKIFDVPRPVSSPGDVDRVLCEEVTPVQKGVQDWLCSEASGGWMCYLCGWKESALPNLQQNVLLKHILCVKSLKMSSKKTRVFNFNHSYILLH